jgi:hypothetical protein
MENELRELQDQISEQANKSLRREELLLKRIKTLEAKIQVTEIKARIKDLESFQLFVVIVTSGILIYNIFV